MLLSLDAKKAFDKNSTVPPESHAVYQGLCHTFSSYIQYIYHNPYTKLVNRQLSSLVPMSQSMRQGCSLSLPHSFNLALYPLLLFFEIQSLTKCSRAQLYATKPSALTHNLLLYIPHPECYDSTILKLIKSFGLISGYTIHFDKSNALHLTNCLKPPWSNLYPFILCKDKLFYLETSIQKVSHNLYKTNTVSLS